MTTLLHPVAYQVVSYGGGGGTIACPQAVSLTSSSSFGLHTGSFTTNTLLTCLGDVPQPLLRQLDIHCQLVASAV